MSPRLVAEDQASAFEKLRREGAELREFLEAANDNEYGTGLGEVELDVSDSA
jgi:hypothetical protein